MFEAVVVGDAGVVGTSGAVDVVVGLAGVVVVVVGPAGVVVVVVLLGAVGVLVGAVVVVVGAVVAVSEVTVMAGGSAGTVTVTVLGSAVTVTVDVFVGVMASITGEVDVGATMPGTCTLAVASIEKLAVAEKLTLIDGNAEWVGEVSVVGAGVDSVVVGVPEPGSAAGGPGSGTGVPGSAADWVVPRSVAVSVSKISPGTGTSLGTPDVVLAVVWLETAPWSNVCAVGSPENGSALFARIGGLESARTKSVVPIAVITNAAMTPARDIGGRNRSADPLADDRRHHRGSRG